MNYPTENDVKKLGFIVRGLGVFIFLCSLVAGAGLVFAAVTEPFDIRFLAGVVVIGLMLHISGSIVFRGYAPRYLLFTHGPK